MDCPTSHPLVKSSLEGARSPKSLYPLTQFVGSLIIIFLVVLSLLFVFFSFSWLASLGFSVWTKFVIFLLMMFLFAVNTSVFVPKRKNDQYREGHTSLLAWSHMATCPVSITERLLKLLPLSSESSSPLVRRIVKSKSKEYFHVSKGISYTTLREEFRKYVKPFVNDIAKYGTHSIKSGAASNPACKNISADLLDMHAGWKCATSKHRYIKRSVNDRLKVSRSIAL